MNRTWGVIGALAVTAALVGCKSTASTSGTSGTTAVTASVKAPGAAAATTAPTAAPVSKVGTIADPVPFGRAVMVTEGGKPGWTVKVVSVTPSTVDGLGGTASAGITFEVVTLQITRLGSMPEAGIEVQDSLIANKVERSSITSPMCYQGNPDNNQVLQGGTTTTGDCISVPTSAVPTLVMAISADFGGSTTYFAVR